MSYLAGLAPAIQFLATGAAEHGEKSPGIADPLVSHWLWTWIIFALVFFLLWKFAFKPLREQLEARENRIRETVEKAAEVKGEAEALLDQHREMMDRVKADAQEIINQGREAAERVKKDTLKTGQTEAQALIERARKEIVLETQKCLDEIRRETVDLTLLAASRVLERSLEDEDHRRMTQSVIEELGQVAGEG